MGLNIFMFAGSIDLKVSRATCLSCQLDWLLYDVWIQSRYVSRNASSMPVDVLWAQTLDILPTMPASAIIECSSWRVPSLVWEVPVSTKWVTCTTISCIDSSFLLQPFAGVWESLAEELPLPSLVPIESGVVWPPLAPSVLVSTVVNCDSLVKPSTPFTSQIQQSNLPPGPTWHANSLCIGLSPSRAARLEVQRKWTLYSCWKSAQGRPAAENKNE